MSNNKSNKAEVIKKILNEALKDYPELGIVAIFHDEDNDTNFIIDNGDCWLCAAAVLVAKIITNKVIHNSESIKKERLH